MRVMNETEGRRHCLLCVTNFLLCCSCADVENPCHQLPLFDHFCCRLAAQPECLVGEPQTASVTLLKPALKKAADQPVFAALAGFRLDFWKKLSHREKGRNPLLSLTLSQVLPVATSQVRREAKV